MAVGDGDISSELLRVEVSDEVADGGGGVNWLTGGDTWKVAVGIGGGGGGGGR